MVIFCFFILKSPRSEGWIQSSQLSIVADTRVNIINPDWNIFVYHATFIYSTLANSSAVC